MEKRYLYKRHNVYWVRVRVPDKVRDIVGKTQLTKNLYTTDLAEANRKKHKIVSEMKQEIHFAERKIDGSLASLSKEDQIRELAIEFRTSSDKTPENLESIFEEVIKNKISELYGEYQSDAIFNINNPEWTGKEPTPKAVKATSDAFRIINPKSNPLSIVSKIYLAERKKDLKTATFKRKESNINQFIRWEGNSDIKNIKNKIAGDYVTQLIERKNHANATLKNIIFDIGSLFTWAEGRGFGNFNPFQKIKLPKEKKSSKKRRPWSDENILLFLQSEKISRNEFVATVVAMYSGMRLDEICNLQNKNIFDKCFHVEEGKTEAAARVIPVHPVIEPLLEKLRGSVKEDYLIRGIKGGGYDKKRSWNFQKKLGRLRQKLGMPEGVNFHTLRNTFVTRMENIGIPTNHINQLIGHKHNNLSLDVYSAGLAIEPLVESINKLTYGDEIDSFIKEILKN